VDRRAALSVDDDRLTYLRLLRDNLADAEVRILDWRRMANQVHLVAVPQQATSLSVLFRRLHGRYAQYYNARWHLWQNRFFVCALGPEHLWRALAYVERNPVRAGMVGEAAEYRWSSAAAHLSGEDPDGVLDLEWWRGEAPDDWAARLRKKMRSLPPNCAAAPMPGSRSRVRNWRWSGASVSGGGGRPGGHGSSQRSPQAQGTTEANSHCSDRNVDLKTSSGQAVPGFLARPDSPNRLSITHKYWD
jgi:REP element-mobilizing transposase RayT